MAANRSCSSGAEIHSSHFHLMPSRGRASWKSRRWGSQTLESISARRETTSERPRTSPKWPYSVSILISIIFLSITNVSKFYENINICSTAAPTVIVSPRTLIQEVGSTAEFKCQASGSPPPQIKWSKEIGNLPEQHSITTDSLMWDFSSFMQSVKSIVDTKDDWWKLIENTIEIGFSCDFQSLQCAASGQRQLHLFGIQRSRTEQGLGIPWSHWRYYLRIFQLILIFIFKLILKSNKLLNCLQYKFYPSSQLKVKLTDKGFKQSMNKPDWEIVLRSTVNHPVRNEFKIKVINNNNQTRCSIDMRYFDTLYITLSVFFKFCIPFMQHSTILYIIYYIYIFSTTLSWLYFQLTILTYTGWSPTPTFLLKLWLTARPSSFPRWKNLMRAPTNALPPMKVESIMPKSSSQY